MSHPSDLTPASAKARLPAGIEPPRTYLDWGAILGGAFVALAVGMLMLTFGAALGLSMVSVEPGEGASLRWTAIGAGIWFLWVVLSSVGAGAYLAGRLRHPVGDAVNDEVELRDGAQGLVVWALAVVLSTMLAASGVTGLTRVAAEATSAVGSGIAEMVEDPLNAAATTLVRNPNGATPMNPDLRDEAAALLTRSMAAGGVSNADRSYIVARVATETGQTPAEVEARLDEVNAMAQGAWQDAQEALEEARRAAVISAFVAAAALIAAAALAYFVAVMGGTHRDQNIPLRTLRR